MSLLYAFLSNRAAYILLEVTLVKRVVVPVACPWSFQAGCSLAIHSLKHELTVYTVDAANYQWLKERRLSVTYWMISMEHFMLKEWQHCEGLPASLPRLLAPPPPPPHFLKDLLNVKLSQETFRVLKHSRSYFTCTSEAVSSVSMVTRTVERSGCIWAGCISITVVAFQNTLINIWKSTTNESSLQESFQQQGGWKCCSTNLPSFSKQTFHFCQSVPSHLRFLVLFPFPVDLKLKSYFFAIIWLSTILTAWLLHNRVNDLQFLTRILKFQRILLTKKRDENDVQKVWIR